MNIAQQFKNHEEKILMTLPTTISWATTLYNLIIVDILHFMTLRLHL
ncbi:hypothetical protein [Lysinibacillus sphaericus]